VAELISPVQVERVAKLCSLHLNPQEIIFHHKTLNQIIEYMQQIEKINTQDIAPTSYCLPLVNVLRPDQPVPSLPREEALANAPSQAEGCFKVPKIL